MSDSFQIVVLCGGTSDERAVSLESGKHAHGALCHIYNTESVRLVELSEDALPEGLSPIETIVFPALHGAFGEDGNLQRLLDMAGIHYAGSGSKASMYCMDKVWAKELVADSGFSLADHVDFDTRTMPSAKEIVDKLGKQLVLKPTDKGSAIGLYLINNTKELKAALESLKDGDWMVEQRLKGREMSVGLLEGRAMGIVEIIPDSGVYDYQHKYTAGSTRYEYPAELDGMLARNIGQAAEAAFEALGCRDIARLDFILADNGDCYFLEMNTLPGLTPTSLLPKSAECAGLDFNALIKRMIAPAIRRWKTSALTKS